MILYGRQVWGRWPFVAFCIIAPVCRGSNSKKDKKSRAVPWNSPFVPPWASFPICRPHPLVEKLEKPETHNSVSLPSHDHPASVSYATPHRNRCRSAGRQSKSQLWHLPPLADDHPQHRIKTNFVGHLHSNRNKVSRKDNRKFFLELDPLKQRYPRRLRFAIRRNTKSCDWERPPIIG